jgi:hypothetical protein
LKNTTKRKTEQNRTWQSILYAKLSDRIEKYDKKKDRAKEDNFLLSVTIE